MPRPAGDERDRRPYNVGPHVTKVCRSVRHEQLMHFVADRVRRHDRHTRGDAGAGDNGRQPARHGTKHHNREAEVFNAVKNPVRNSPRHWWVRLRRQIEDPGHVREDRTPQADPANWRGQSGSGYSSQPMRTPAAMNPANSFAPNHNWSRGSSRISEANTIETNTENSAISPRCDVTSGPRRHPMHRGRPACSASRPRSRRRCRTRR